MFLIWSALFNLMSYINKIIFLGLQTKSAAYTVGEFMTKKEDLCAVKPTTTVDEGIRNSTLMFPT